MNANDDYNRPTSNLHDKSDNVNSGVSRSLTMSTMMILDAAADMFADDLDTESVFQGREGSIHAEDEILGRLLPHEGEDMRRKLNAILEDAGSPWRFGGFIHRGSDTEAEKREWIDISVRMIRNNEPVVVPVNIKATKGGTADNLCSWMAYDYAVIGDDSPARTFAAHARKMMKTGGILDDSSENDYLVWTFYKDEDNHLTGEHDSGSLLSSRPDIDIRFNNAQSLPIQMLHTADDNTSSMKRIEYMSIPIGERRRALEQWLMGNISRMAHSRGDKADAILDMLGRR